MSEANTFCDIMGNELSPGDYILYAKPLNSGAEIAYRLVCGVTNGKLKVNEGCITGWTKHPEEPEEPKRAAWMTYEEYEPCYHAHYAKWAPLRTKSYGASAFGYITKSSGILRVARHDIPLEDLRKLDGAARELGFKPPSYSDNLAECDTYKEWPKHCPGCART